MASKRPSPLQQPRTGRRVIRYPYQLVLMADAQMDTAVRTYADDTGQPIAAALRELVGIGLDARRKGWRKAAPATVGSPVPA